MSEIYPGEGWRLLNDGERIEAGDEYLDRRCVWMPLPDRLLGDVIGSHYATHRRRVPAATADAARTSAGSVVWTPVTERLPEPDYMGNAVGVLACLPNGEVCIGFCENDGYGVRWHCQSTKKPTHWMPLPAPPTGV
jgi:hypothetical protein